MRPVEYLAHKEIQTEIPPDGGCMCSWNFVVKSVA